VGATESRFGELVPEDGAVVPGRTLPWLTNGGHLGLAEFGADSDLIELLRSIYIELGGNEDALANKRRGSNPKPDFLRGEGQQIVEVDEIQHFTSDRLLTFRMYPATADVAFDLQAYVGLCESWGRTGDRYRSAKPTVDFPHPGGRRAQRAYFDAVRDVAAPAFGNGPVIRVPAPECNGDLAYRRFCALTEAMG
jgi:hypothetical protein